MSTPSKATPKAETPLGQVTPKWAQAFILKQMFYKFLGARPELDNQLRAAYRERFGRDMRDLLPYEMINAAYLEGPPGQGKTSVHKAAAREFARLMKMHFHEKVTQRQLAANKIGIKDFVFSVIELAGETSNKEVFGLMTKVRVGDREFMGHLPDWRLAATMFAGYGYVLFDDFATATHQVQNSTLGLLLDGSAGDLQFNMNEIGQAKMAMGENQLVVTMPESESGPVVKENASTVHFGLAGNRGTRDGNKIFPITTATATRVMRFDVEDTVEQWIDRAMTDNCDDLGDCHVCSMLTQIGDEHFLRLAKQEKGMMGQMPVSRTWNMLLTGVRTVFAEAGGLSRIVRLSERDMGDVLYDIEKLAEGSVGKDAAGAVGAFYNSLFLGAAPVAEDIIREGKVDTDLINQKYGGGNSPDGQNFGFALASALASFAAEYIVKELGRNPSKADIASLADVTSPKSKALRGVLKHFSYGVNQFTNLSMSSLAANQMMRRLTVAAPALFAGTGDFRAPTEEFAVLLAHGMFVDNTLHSNPDNIEDLAAALSTYSAVFDGNFETDIRARITKLGAPKPQ